MKTNTLDAWSRFNQSAKNDLFKLCVFSVALLMTSSIGAGQGIVNTQSPLSQDDRFADELPRIASLSPAESLTKFSLLAGYEIELVTHEPHIADPVAIAFDEKARMYVVEMVDYSEQSTDHLGVIKRLTDNDGDGFYETSSRFATGLSWPTAIACYDQGVFVGAAPDILFLKDNDDDGVADTQTKVFTGFGRSNVQGLLNSFRWGLDNRIYGQTSVSGASVTASVQPDAKPINLQGKDFSFDPKQLDIRMECGGGQHGMSFDDYGNRFTCHNSDNLQAFLYEHRYEQTKRLLPLPPSRRSIAVDGPQANVFRTSPVEPWRILRTKLRVSGVTPGLLEGGGRPSGYFTSATGVTVYNGDQMPELYGQAFIADVGSNLIHRKRLSRDSIGWKGERIDVDCEFISSADTWFRPVQFANAPDGCLYILDFYREVIEHPQSLPDSIKRHLDLTNGRDKGRIYRVRDARRPVQYQHDLSKFSTTQLVNTLQHPNGWHRETARRLLWTKLIRSLDSTESQRLLDDIETLFSSREATSSEQGRAGGLDGLAILTLAKRQPRNLDLWLEHADPNVRIAAIRLLDPLALNQPKLRQRLYTMASDSDIGVRFQLALTMSLLTTDQDESEHRIVAVKNLLDQMPIEPSNHNPAYRAAVANLMEPHAVLFMQDHLTTLTQINGAGQGRDSPRSPPKINGAASQLLGYCFGCVARDEELQAFDHKWSDMVRLSRKALDSNNPSLDNDWNKQILRGFLEGLSTKPGFVNESISRLPAIQVSVTELIEESVACLANADRPLADRIQSIRELKWASEPIALMNYYMVLHPSYPMELQEKALEGLSNHSESTIATGILERYHALTPAMRGRVIDLLLRRPAWLEQLVDHLVQGDISWEDLSASQRTTLRNHQNRNVRDRVARFFENAITNRSEIISRYQDALSLNGNIDNGKALFVKHCSACHIADGVGYEVGPNLTAFRYRGSESLLQNILDPNREVNPMYLSYNVRTNDDATISGMIQSESTEQVQLTRGGEYRDTVLRSNIAEMKSSRVSIMPEGFENQLDQQSMADLLAYLMQLR